MTLSHGYLIIHQYVSRSKLLDNFLVKVLQIEVKNPSKFYVLRQDHRQRDRQADGKRDTQA
jgi:hypothetical protein